MTNFFLEIFKIIFFDDEKIFFVQLFFYELEFISTFDLAHSESDCDKMTTSSWGNVSKPIDVYNLFIDLECFLHGVRYAFWHELTPDFQKVSKCRKFFRIVRKNIFPWDFF